MKNKKIITSIIIMGLLSFGYGYMSYAQEEVAQETTQEEQVVVEEEIIVLEKKSLKRPEKALETLEAFDYSIARLQNLSGRISNKINEMEEADFSIGTTRNNIKEANNLIRSAFGELKKIKEQTNRYIALGEYEEGYIETTRTTLASIKNNGESAQRIMKDIVVELKKGAGQNTSKQVSGVLPLDISENTVLDSVSNLLDTKE